MGNNMGNTLQPLPLPQPQRDFNGYYGNNVMENNEPSLIIKPFLFLGGVYARKNPRVLEHLGITHVLNMASELHLDTVYLTNRNINVKHIPAEDYETYNIRQHFEEAFQFIEDCLMKNGRILVHCAVGISRSPTIVIAYIMYRYGMSCQAAYQYVQGLRPHVNPNNAFKMQLQEFEYELQGLNRSSQQQPQQQSLTTSQQYLANLIMQNRLGYLDNVNTTNTSNFNMNGMNPLNLKVGSKKNYHANYNSDKGNYLPTDKNMIPNAYFVDPSANAFRRRNSLHAAQNASVAPSRYARSTTFMQRPTFSHSRSIQRLAPYPPAPYFAKIADFNDYNRRNLPTRSIDNSFLGKNFEKTRSILEFLN